MYGYNLWAHSLVQNIKLILMLEISLIMERVYDILVASNFYIHKLFDMKIY